jgi:protein-S-isoprenylcysteine O-methyltransferase Ste14
MPPVLKITVATIVYGLVHSLLASHAVKRRAASLLGQNNYRAFYRPFYIGQAVVTTGALAVYGLRLRTPTLYHVRGLPAYCLRAGQVLALVYLYTAAREIGLLRLTGIDGMLLHVRGRSVPEAPVAQGPEADIVTGSLTTGGPFRASRHPLNFSAVPLFWLTPKLSMGRLAFNVVATLYLVLGSLHEELRLRQAYGRDYRTYVRSGAAFFLPRPRRQKYFSTSNSRLP